MAHDRITPYKFSYVKENVKRAETRTNMVTAKIVISTTILFS